MLRKFLRDTMNRVEELKSSGDIDNLKAATLVEAALLLVDNGLSESGFTALVPVLQDIDQNEDVKEGAWWTM